MDDYLSPITLGVVMGFYFEASSFSFLLYLTNLKSCLNLEAMVDDSKLKISGKAEEILTSVELGNFEQLCSNHTLSLNSDETKCLCL